jgi:hypothetical protein
MTVSIGMTYGPRTKFDAHIRIANDADEFAGVCILVLSLVQAANDNLDQDISKKQVPESVWQTP